MRYVTDFFFLDSWALWLKSRAIFFYHFCTISSDKESLASSLSSSNDSEDDGESMSEQSDDVEVIDSFVEPVVVPVPTHFSLSVSSFD